MMYTMPKNLLSICVNFALATQQILFWYAEPLFENSLFKIPLFPLFCQQLFFIFLHFMQTLEIPP